jgi:Sec-independent protein secretion pathway component TatC
MINKVIAGLSTIGFMAIVQPDDSVSLAGVALTAVLMYEGLTFCVDYVRRINQKKREDRYITVSRQDMKRWADTQLYWPIEEVGR